MSLDSITLEISSYKMVSGIKLGGDKLQACNIDQILWNPLPLGSLRVHHTRREQLL